MFGFFIKIGIWNPEHGKLQLLKCGPVHHFHKETVLKVPSGLVVVTPPAEGHRLQSSKRTNGFKIYVRYMSSSHPGKEKIVRKLA